MPRTARHAALHQVTLHDGRRLQARVWPGRGRPLVLLHGLLDDSAGWREFAHGTRRPCVAIDLPGFGGSDLPSRPRVSAYGEAVAEGLTLLGVDRAALVGHSLGGAVAVAVAERSPAIEALALIAPCGFGPVRLSELVSVPGVIDLAEKALPLALVNPVAVAAGYALVARGHRPTPDLIERLRRHAGRSGPAVRAAVTAIAAAGRSPHGFARREVPFTGRVAALWGARDALVPASHAAAVARTFAHAQIEVWPAMGHHPQRERPAELAAFVERAALVRPHRSAPAARAAS